MALRKPPRIGYRVRRAVGVGIATVILAPFLQNLVAYWDGRKGWFFISVWSLLLFGVIGLVTLVVVSESRTLFTSAQRRLRVALALCLALGGPAWFVSFQRSGAAMELKGMVDAAQAHVNLEALQAWAVQALAAVSNAPPDEESAFHRQPLPWESVPSDVAAFLGGSGSAWVIQTRGQLSYVEVEKRPRAFVVGNRDFRCAQMHPSLTAELAPGVYLQRRIRP